MSRHDVYELRQMTRRLPRRTTLLVALGALLFVGVLHRLSQVAAVQELRGDRAAQQGRAHHVDATIFYDYEIVLRSDADDDYRMGPARPLLAFALFAFFGGLLLGLARRLRWRERASDRWTALTVCGGALILLVYAIGDLQRGHHLTIGASKAIEVRTTWWNRDWSTSQTRLVGLRSDNGGRFYADWRLLVQTDAGDFVIYETEELGRVDGLCTRLAARYSVPCTKTPSVARWLFGG